MTYLNRGTSAIIVIITTIHALSPLAMQIFVPALPAILSDFSAARSDTQWVVTGFSVALAVAMLAYGPISDRFGRRRVILLGLTLFSLGSALCYWADSLGMLVLGRVVQAVGVAAGSTMGRAVAADILPPEKLARAVSFMTMALVMGPMLAPVAAGYLVSSVGWRSIPLLLGAVSLLLLLMALTWMPETHDPESMKQDSVTRESLLNASKSPFLTSWILGHLTVLIAVQIGVYGFLSAAPYLVEDLLGYEPYHFGYVFIYLTCGYLLGNAFSGWGRSSGPGLLAWAIICYGAGAGLMLALALNDVISLHSIVGPVILLSFANGISQPQCMAAALNAAPDRRGQASSLVGFSQIMAGGVGFQLMGWLPADSPVPLAWLACFCALGGAIGLWLIRGSRAPGVVTRPRRLSD